MLTLPHHRMLRAFNRRTPKAKALLSTSQSRFLEALRKLIGRKPTPPVSPSDPGGSLLTEAEAFHRLGAPAAERKPDPAHIYLGMQPCLRSDETRLLVSGLRDVAEALIELKTNEPAPVWLGNLHYLVLGLENLLKKLDARAKP